jgi:membrane protein DedA with SNARE-associated domain
MDFLEGIVIWGVVAIVAGAAGGIIAGVKNRDYSAWIAWSFLLPPLVLILLIMPKHKGTRPRQRHIDAEEHGF